MKHLLILKLNFKTSGFHAIPPNCIKTGGVWATKCTNDPADDGIQLRKRSSLRAYTFLGLFFPVFLTKTPWLPWEIHMPGSLALVVPSVHTAHSVPPDLKVFCSPTHSLLYHVNRSKKRLSNQSLFNKQCYQCLGDSCTVYDMGTSGHLLACINWHGDVVFWPGTPDRKLNLQNQTVVIYIPWCPPRWATGLHANNF